MADFPLAKFRVLYPAFDEVADEVVLAVAELGECFLSKCDESCTEQAWMLITAHMLYLRGKEEAGESQPGAVTSASIDRVSVSFAAPPAGTSEDFWFGMTPYGQQLLALLTRCRAGSASPFYVGSMPERAAFRSVGGRFPRGGRSW